MSKTFDQLSPQQQWVALFDEEFRARDAIDRTAAERKRPDGRQLRTWWRAVELLCRKYTELVIAGTMPDPPPVELLGAFARMAGYLAVGQIPRPIRDSAKEGRRAPGPTERAHIGLAVAYHRACTRGTEYKGQTIRVVDPTPTKTISNAFGINPSTAREWVRKYDPVPLIQTHMTPDMLRKLMLRAGAFYQKAGRSHDAIVNRNGKHKAK